MKQLKNMKSLGAFTMIELVFVIVVLGILAAIAVPKFSATRTDAEVTKGRADVSAIRSGIVSVRQKYLLRGHYGYINQLSSGGSELFDGNGTAGTEIMMYPVTPVSGKNGHWSGSDPDYTYRVDNQNCVFHYDSSTGKFELNSASAAIAICKQLVP